MISEYNSLILAIHKLKMILEKKPMNFHHNCYFLNDFSDKLNFSDLQTDF